MHLQTKSEGKNPSQSNQTGLTPQKTERTRSVLLLTARRKRWVRLLCFFVFVIVSH